MKARLRAPLNLLDLDRGEEDHGEQSHDCCHVDCPVADLDCLVADLTRVAHGTLPFETASFKTRSRTFRTEQVAVPGHSDLDCLVAKLSHRSSERVKLLDACHEVQPKLGRRREEFAQDFTRVLVPRQRACDRR
eukprot:CAMPEP_0179910058 /NCGR_PEP_ID=MMETSP0982-20121206/45566_1 /TAXON_ID=483367 /ORGANISM="non described non described, Strain CCMP 2436" /LENGTH=133 /DNA_ID=CAMNT_0021811589 /DNA_START=803 /DNA_END=1200 /DNA_ORIENTATION=-